jgi:hypothetical protein
MTLLRHKALVTGSSAAAVVALASFVGTQPAVASTSVQQCTDHMQAPWVALYEHPNFQGDSVCILGTGLNNLNGIGWGNRASSVNIGAEGYATDGSVGAYNAGRYMSYHYGTRIADLRTVGWDDRIQILHTSG